MLVIKEENDREESRGTEGAVERLELRAQRRSSMALERTRR